MTIYTGSGVAIVTPFNEDFSINYEVFEKMLDFQLDNGTDAIIVAGTTGEASTQTDEEQLELIRFAVDHVDGRVPVIGGAGSNDTRHGVELTKGVQEAGADAVLSVTPYYLKTNQSGLVAHYKEIAGAIDLPIILYDVPGRTGMTIESSTLPALLEIDNIVAIKDAVGDLAKTVGNVQATDGKIDMYSGNDDVVVPLMSMGGKGVISVLANIAPQAVHDMVQAALDGDFAKAAKIQADYKPLIDVLFQEPNPIPVKEALKYIGFETGPARLPLGEPSDQTKEDLKREMKAVGLID